MSAGRSQRRREGRLAEVRKVGGRSLVELARDPRETRLVGEVEPDAAALVAARLQACS